MKTESAVRFNTVTRMGLGLVLLVGCWLVLQPFLPAILFSVAIAVSTWPAYAWLLRRLQGRRYLASLLSCFVVAVLVIAPTVVLAMSFSDGAAWLLRLVDEWRGSGPLQPPAWLERIPVFGNVIRDRLEKIAASDDPLAQMLPQLMEPARRLALAGGRALGWGVAQALFAELLLFFLYRDGTQLGKQLDNLAAWLGGPRGRALLATAERTVVGVMISVIGTALAQSMVATLGFYIAGVPNPFLLGALTFIASIAPIGPPLIWGGAALWLFRQEQLGWALFMLLYGFFGISTIDNVIKPFLISRSSHLPFALTFMGVIGGVLAFGVAGVFIGPTLLALAINLGKQMAFNSDTIDETGAAPPADP
jgi:predicted PurR-regulated permease PerM